MANKLMSIVVLNWNRKHYSTQTIENIIKRTTIPNELILVDNNSKEEGLKDYLSSVKGNSKTQRVECVFNDRNLGVSGGRNSGLVRAKGDYLVTIDDDVLVPHNWDVLMASACDRIQNLGITGVNVEPNKYPVKNINGIKVCPKNGNLGGACLCLPKRVFDKVGYYNYFSTYGHEDCAMYYRLTQIKLMSAYIEPRGTHLDKDLDKAYRQEKNKAHKGGSVQLSELSRYLKEMRKTGNVYVSFDPNYIPPDEQFFTNDLVLKDRKK